MAPEQVRGDRVTPACDVFLAWARSSRRRHRRPALRGGEQRGARDDVPHRRRRIPTWTAYRRASPTSYGMVCARTPPPAPASTRSWSASARRTPSWKDAPATRGCPARWWPNSGGTPCGCSTRRTRPSAPHRLRRRPRVRPPPPAQEPAPGSAPAALDLSKSSAAPTPTSAPAPEVAPEHAATPPPPGRTGLDGPPPDADRGRRPDVPAGRTARRAPRVRPSPAAPQPHGPARVRLSAGRLGRARLVRPHATVRTGPARHAGRPGRPRARAAAQKWLLHRRPDRRGAGRRARRGRFRLRADAGRQHRQGHRRRQGVLGRVQSPTSPDSSPSSPSTPSSLPTRPRPRRPRTAARSRRGSSAPGTPPSTTRRATTPAD